MGVYKNNKNNTLSPIASNIRLVDDPSALMLKSTYDPNGVVEDAGGIEGYVEDSFENLDTNDVSIYTGLTEIFDINHIENPFPPGSPFISLVRRTP